MLAIISAIHSAKRSVSIASPNTKRNCLVHGCATGGDQASLSLSLKLAKQRHVTGFLVHGNVVRPVFYMKRLQPHAFGVVGAVSHPYKVAQGSLFILPDRPLGPDHHLVGADGSVFIQAPEIAEK